MESKKRIIGLHIRRGDKNSENPLIPINKYVEFINFIKHKNPNDLFLVYLASDQEKAYFELCSLIPKEQILFDLNEDRYDNYNAGMVLENPELALQESLTAAKNIKLLGECDYVIGMSTAQFTWLGGLLAVYNNNLDISRHIMICPHTNRMGHWANYYGFNN